MMTGLAVTALLINSFFAGFALTTALIALGRTLQKDRDRDRG